MTSALGTIFVITGPTAAGKTELSLRWAERHDAEIVSCDSLLFYRGMDIGTAKPTPGELARVPHHLIDIREPGEAMDVGEYTRLAIATVREIQSRGKRVLVAGGSGFYLKAFYAPVVDDVAVDDAIRERAASLLAESGLEAALSELSTLNPGGLGSLDTRNPRRVAKALERCWASGETLATLERRFREQRNPLIDAAKRTVVLARPADALAERIRQRVDLMLASGLVEEVKRLREAGFERNPSASRAIGYREVLAMLDGAFPESDLAETISGNTRRLAKKQRTWLRHQLPDTRTIELGEGRPVDPEELFA